MNRGRFTMLAVAALIVLAAALYLGSRRNAGEPSAEGALFLPQLAGELGTVSERRVAQIFAGVARLAAELARDARG